MSEENAGNEGQVETSWRDGMSEDNKGMYSEIGSTDDLMKGYDGLVKKMGTNPIVRPNDNSTDEERSAYVDTLSKELGRPDNVDGYLYDVPEGLDVNNDSINLVKDAALKNGVSDKAFKAMAEAFLGDQHTQINAMNEANAAADLADVTALQGEWGDKFDDNLNSSLLAGKKVFGEEFVEANKGNKIFMEGMLKMVAPLGEGKLGDSGSNEGMSNETMRDQARKLAAEQMTLRKGSHEFNEIERKRKALYTQMNG
jgi:hypothetical protein